MASVEFGFLTCIVDTFGFGNALLYFCMAASFALLLLPVISVLIKGFKCVSKKDFIRLGCSFLAILIISSVPIFIEKNVEKRYNSFDIELWNEYPRQRRLMAEDLENELVGKNEQYIFSLLGNPEFEHYSVSSKSIKTLYYEYDYFSLNCELHEGKCVSVYCSY